MLTDSSFSIIVNHWQLKTRPVVVDAIWVFLQAMFILAQKSIEDGRWKEKCIVLEFALKYCRCVLWTTFGNNNDIIVTLINLLNVIIIV